MLLKINLGGGFLLPIAGNCIFKKKEKL